MDTLKLLTTAGVPEHYHADALRSLDDARDRSKGLLWHKFKVRYLKAGKIAKLIPWEAERLIDVRPDLASWDIESVTKVTAQGDKGGWMETPEGGRPIPHEFTNSDPESAEYQLACRTNHYSPGLHPRSEKSRRNWYRRNGGAHEAYVRGKAVDPAQYQKPWSANGVTVHHNNGAWLIVAKIKWLGFIPVTVRKGFEIDNVFSGTHLPQAWFPIPGYELKAPVTWSVRPG